MINFKNLSVWEKSIEFTVKLYSSLNNLPNDENYGLSSQMKRASISISSNIAEATSRKTVKDISRFFDIALGSSFELETQIIISGKLNFLQEDQVLNLIAELNIIQSMLYKYNRKMQDSTQKSVI